jgi:hypothetical protein
MIDGFIDTLRSWQNFYFMIGGASAALLGLMFVALSLGQHLITETTRESVETFAEPNIYYFTTALLICALMLAPFINQRLFAWVMLIGSIIAIGRQSHYVYLLIRAAIHHGDFNFGDWLGQVIVPMASYIVLLAAGIMVVDLWHHQYMGHGHLDYLSEQEPGISVKKISRSFQKKRSILSMRGSILRTFRSLNKV